MRFIHARLPRESVTSLYRQTNSLQIRPRQTWLLLTLFYKTVVRSEGPEYIRDIFTRSADIHHYHTRSRATSFVPPRARTRAMGGSFQVLAVGAWNALPTTLYLKPDGGLISTAAFRVKLKQFLTRDEASDGLGLR